MTELDFEQKLAMRGLFWAMGATTRIDVKLSALIPRERSRARSGTQEWTDLDVLGVLYPPIVGLTYAVADCKTLKGRVTERVFWLRGVADLFGARAAYLCRDEAVPAAARQLGLRLGISILDREDRERLIEQSGRSSLPAVGTFLEGPALTAWTRLIGDTPSSIERLQRYRRTGYWIAPRHRNLVYLPTQLESARSMKSADRWALALVADFAWLYLLALLAALDDMTRLHLSEPGLGLRQVLVGSEHELRERERLAEQLRVIVQAVKRGAAAAPPVSVLPEYYEDLLELVSRLARLRQHASEALRVLEFVGVETIANRGARWDEAFAGGSPLAPKIAGDIVRFLVRAAKLDPAIVGRFDALLIPPPIAPKRDRSGQQPLFREGDVRVSAFSAEGDARARDSETVDEPEKS